MSSNDKRDLTTKNNSTKEASATVIGDVVTLPPDSDDVIFTTICDDSINGVVDAELEMSYDKENWCPAVAEEFTAGESVVGWGNEKYIDTIPTPDLVGTCSVGDHESRSACEGAGGTWTPTEHKNKYAQGTKSYDTAGNEVGTTTGTRDVLYNFIKKDKPFNLNWWHKSETIPNTIVHFDNEQYFSKGGTQGDHFTTTNLTASGSNQILRNTKAWTISFWYKTSSVVQGVFWGNNSGSTDVMHSGIAAGDRLFIQGGGNTVGFAYYDFIPSADTWYHIVVTNEPVASDGDDWYWDRDDSASQKGLKIYINGSAVSRHSGNTTNTGTMFSDSNPFRMFSRGSWNTATGDYDEISIHNTTKSDSEVSSMYASGTPTDLSSDSSCKVWLRADGMENGGLENGDVITNSMSASSSTYVTTCVTDYIGDISVANLATSESIYIAPSSTTNYNPIIFRHGNKDPFSNEKYLDFSKGTGEYKNKSAKAPLDQQSNTRDIFHEKMGADKSFTINKWFKSSEPPATTTTYPFSKCMEIADSSDTGEGFLEIQNTIGSATQAFHVQAQNVTPTALDWTMSFWYKAPSAAVPTGDTSRVLAYFGKSWFLYITTSGVFKLANWYVSGTVTMPSGKDLFDGNWHLLTFAWRHDSGLSTTASDYNMNRANDTGNEGEPGSSIWIDGVPFDFTYNYHTVPPARDYYDMGIGNYSPEDVTSTEAFPGKYAHIALEAKALTTSEVVARYNANSDGNGVPLDLSSEVEFYLNFEDESIGALSSSSNLTESGKGYNDSGTPGSDYPTAITGDLSSIVALSDTNMKGTPTYTDEYLPVLFNNGATDGSSFGNGLTASFTKKLGSGTTWNPAGTETTKLLLSFDGFEDGADAFNAYDASSLLDGNWHNLQITYKGAPTEDTPDTDTEDVKVFVDGAELSISDSGNNKLNKTAANKHFKYTTGTFVPGTFGASGWKETNSSTDYIYAFQGALDNLSLHSEVTDLTKAKEFYGKDTSFEGKPHNYQMSASLTYANVEGWWTFDDGADDLNTAQDKTSNNIDLTLNNFASGGNGYVTMTNSDSIYVNNLLKGEGLTLSITKNLKDDGTWVDTQDQTARLIMSFNGIERDAEYWVAYNTNQTGLSPAVNLLDGLWHSVTLSYQGLGNATDGYTNNTYDLPNDEIRFGPTQIGGTNQPYHFSLAFDGQVLKDINGGKGYNLAKGGATGSDANAGFVLQNKHLRHTHSDATYIPTTYLASGISEVAGQDSIYAFQGGFDESSFHSDSWWTTDAWDYNQEKPLTIYGISSGLSNSIRFAPYNMRSPADIEVTAGQNQYIDPNPYNASTNANGGMEVYYRWGDTTGDCSQSIRDVRGHETSPVNTNRDIVAQNILHSDATLLDTDASESTLYDKDLTENNSGTYKMYQEKLSSTTLGGLNVNAIKISGCTASKCQQRGVLAPKLPHMRVKWSGDGSCNLGEDKCRAQLWFRRRKK